MKKIAAFGVFLIAVAVFCFWFYLKLFPSSSGSWDIYKGAINDNHEVARSGWTDRGIWVSVDFPQQQRVCIEIAGDVKPVSAAATRRTILYPDSGPLFNLLDKETKKETEREIWGREPFLLGHLSQEVVKYGKNIFFLGNKEKYLIPTNSIYISYFPLSYIPPSTKNESNLPYSEDIIGFPEGLLISHQEGVYVISDREKSLIRSPEIFLSLGYKWEDAREVIPFEAGLHKNAGNPIDFYYPHPNGTILDKDGMLFLVWRNQLYEITYEEKDKYFKYQPVVEVGEKEVQSSCSSSNGSTVCCVENFDPRENPPDYGSFANTIIWEMDNASEKNFKWRIERIKNRENLIYRLRGLKYKLGIFTPGE